NSGWASRQPRCAGTARSAQVAVSIGRTGARSVRGPGTVDAKAECIVLPSGASTALAGALSARPSPQPPACVGPPPPNGLAYRPSGQRVTPLPWGRRPRRSWPMIRLKCAGDPRTRCPSTPSPHPFKPPPGTRREDKMRVAIIGQQDFGKATMEAFLNRGDEVAAVFCAPEKGRPDPLRVAAQEKGLTVHQLPRLTDPAALDAMKAANVQVGVMAFVTQFVPQSLCEIPQLGTIQFHPS